MKKISIMILVLVVALASCKKTPEVNLKYVDVERDLITVGTTTATMQCDYQYITTLKKAYLYYGKGEDEADMNTVEMRVVQNTLYVDLAGLRENTTYSYYYEFHNGFNSMRTVAKTFKTEGSDATITLPTVVTAEVTEITTNSAKGGGEVTNDGGAEVTERGICWSTNTNPTLNDNHVTAGTGTGAFTAMMNGLEANTTYHVRAYATNEVGTAYGLDREFVTVGGGGSGIPEGAIDGLFSVSPTQKVYFSQGNLQYQASTNTWRFAEHQWDYVGGIDETTGNEFGNVYENGIKCNNSLLSEAYAGWIDLFGFGANGHYNGFDCYQPWSESIYPDDFYGYNLFDESGNADWGYNSVINGGNQPNRWRTLKQEEWRFVLKERTTISGARFALARLDGINGLILVPDDWNESWYELNNVNGGNDVNTISFSNNIISTNDWVLFLEAHGAAFLPACGCRFQTRISNVDQNDGRPVGIYFSSNVYGEFSISINLEDGSVGPDLYSGRMVGHSVRLAQDAH